MDDLAEGGPTFWFSLQAIEHLNKMLRSCMHTWTSEKKSFLVTFLKTCYEMLVGKYVGHPDFFLKNEEQHEKDSKWVSISQMLA